jgi:hypothetical protein
MWTEPDFIIGISCLIGAALYLTGIERGGAIERARQKLRLRTHPPMWTTGPPAGGHLEGAWRRASGRRTAWGLIAGSEP